MRAVWSFWSKPFQMYRYGFWATPRQHLETWVLSVTAAREHYPDTWLYTDDVGASLLIDGLDLPFEHVSTALNALDQYDPGWWALGKLFAYHLQDEPFVHIDNDVFLWKRLPQFIECAPVFAQNPEQFTMWPLFYQPGAVESLLRVESNAWIPEEWSWYRSGIIPQRGDCCGVFGGNDLDFISHFSRLALQFLDHPGNRRGWSQLGDKMTHMLLLEQYLLAACLEYHRDRPGSPFRDVRIEYVFQTLDDTWDDDIAAKVGYTHLIAEAKRDPDLAVRLDQRIERDFPEYHRRCIELAG